MYHHGCAGAAVSAVSSRRWSRRRRNTRGEARSTCLAHDVGHEHVVLSVDIFLRTRHPPSQPISSDFSPSTPTPPRPSKPPLSTAPHPRTHPRLYGSAPSVVTECDGHPVEHLQGKADESTARVEEELSS